MCGVVGVVGTAVADRSVSDGLRRLRHRGPDGAGVLRVELPWGEVLLGVARLAVVDRRPLRVPLDFRRSCGVVLAYNGEVYDWRALRAELSDGLPWETDCDAEVVARGWRRWGPGVLDRLNGMFAFALVDALRGEVLLARDRAGEKPLYLARVGDGLAFASEAKALPGVELREASCADLEALEFDFGEETPLAGVRSLPPGSLLHLRSRVDLGRRPARWWSLPAEVDEGLTLEDAADEAEELVVDSVRLRAAAEVPVAVLLSGGLDSAVVQAVVRSSRLYTVSFPGDGVLDLARAAALGAGEPVHVEFGLEDLRRVLGSVAYHLDTPATWTAVAQWFLARRLAGDGVVVALSGEGADELFGGYARYRLLWHLDRAAADPLLAVYGPLRRYLLGSEEEVLARLLDRGGTAASRERALQLAQREEREGRRHGSLVGSAWRLDWSTTMQVLLRMFDRTLMAHGVEGRAPSLDHRLVELGARLPDRLRISPAETKPVLRGVARRLGVPEVVVGDRTKRGLAVPWAAWTGAGGERGAFSRASFAAELRAAWRAAFFGSRAEAAAE